MPKSAKNLEKMNFETALAQLNTLVEQMEKGGLSLEQSLESYEQGLSLVRHCQTLLKNAEQKIQIYREQTQSLEPFEES